MDHVELRHLRYFVAVAEELHFSRAAERLFVTQSNLSTQIRLLEDEVGGALLVRTSRAVELTEAGQLLLVEARRVLEQAERAMHVAHQSVLGEVGSLRVGFSGVAAYSGVLAADLRAFRRAHPAVELDLVELPPSSVAAEVRAGTIDLGYVPDRDRALSGDLHFVVRRGLEFVAAVGDEHPLARREQLTRRDLDRETLIFPSGPQGDPLLADRVQSARGRRRGPLRFVPSTLGVLTLAAAGVGIAIVPGDLRTMAMPDLSYVPISDLAGPELSVVTRRDETLGSVRGYLTTLSAP